MARSFHPRLSTCHRLSRKGARLYSRRCRDEKRVLPQPVLLPADAREVLARITVARLLGDY